MARAVDQERPRRPLGRGLDSRAVLPAPLLDLLGARASDAPHVALRSGLGSPVGESHLIVVDGALRVFARGSLLDPLVEVTDVRRARVEETSLRAELVLDRGDERASISLGFGEPERVAELLAAVDAPAVAEDARAEEAPAAIELPVRADQAPAAIEAPRAALEADRETAAELLGIMAQPKQHFLGVLAARHRRPVKEPARHRPQRAARDVEPEGHVEPEWTKPEETEPDPRTLTRAERRERQASRPRNERPRDLARPRGTPIPDVTRDAPEEPASSSPWAAWLVLVALVVIGLASALRRLLAG